MLAFYGPISALRVARKHLGWYLDAAGTPPALRREVLTADEPASARSFPRPLDLCRGRMKHPIGEWLWASLPVPAFLLDPGT
jgi:hypothetical protein